MQGVVTHVLDGVEYRDATFAEKFEVDTEA